MIFLALIFNGGFNEYVSCGISALISVYLVYRIFKTKKIFINLNLFSISVFLISGVYGLSAIWAIDSGMAFIGFLKFLPVSLYLFGLWQDNKSNIIDSVPVFASILVLISMIGMHISITENFFTVSGRLAGFFQYPNTFALFLLVCELLLMSKEKFEILDYICIGLLIIGLLYTGSRTAFVIALLTNLVLMVLKLRTGQNKKYYLITFVIMLATIIAVLILNKEILGRYMSISVLESTFVGRILYWFDALPLLLKYPFGMGYLGYSYYQTIIQTGVYTVKYIHNDFLQLFLDIGWIPTVIFMTAIILILLKSKQTFAKKIIISAICLHSFFDFNLQFTVIFLILITLCNNESGKTIVINKKTVLVYGALIIIVIVNIYMGIHLLLSTFHKNDIAQKLYPYNTENMIAILETETNLEKANDIADKIIEQNQITYIPYSIKSKYYYSIGNIDALISAKHTVFEKNPFKYEEYEEYCEMLIACISRYYETGDIESVKYCINELIRTKEFLEQNRNLLSDLGKKIKDQPQTKLSDSVLFFINRFLEERI